MKKNFFYKLIYYSNSSLNSKYNSQTLNILFDNSIKKYKTPAFKFLENQIELISSPSDFYIALIKSIRESEERIILSSLYIGTSELEKFLIMELEKKIKQNPKFKITILLDYSRGIRKEKIFNNSLSMLKPLFNVNHINNPNLNIYFLKHPNIKSYHNYLPSILSEVAGVLHSKLYIFDNNVIISGANLSENYFTSRQDRYWIFQDNEPFADFCEDFLISLSENSYKINSNNNSLELDQFKLIGEASNSKVKFIEAIQHHFKMFKYEHKVQISEGEDLRLNEYLEDLSKYNSYSISRIDEDNLLKFNINERQKEINEIFFDINDNIKENKLLSYFNKSEKNNKNSQSNVNKSCSKEPIYVFPSFQFKEINILDDQNILKNILSDNTEISNLTLSTGYFNPSKSLKEVLLKQENFNIKTITSSPEANSFYNGGFIKSYIPFIYRLYQFNFMKNSNLKAKCYEYIKENFSFHSKGIWLYRKNENYPFFSIIGSSNYNRRSYERDIESQFYIYTDNINFQKKMQKEVDSYFIESELLTKEKVKKTYKLRHKYLGYILNSYL